MDFYDFVKDNSTDKNQIEHVEQKKHEYHFIGRTRKQPGHVMYSYNTKTGELKQAELIRCKDCSEFLNHEAELRKAQKEAIEARVPKFEKYRGTKGFDRIATYTGFVFDKPEELDPREWKTELVEGYLLSTPNKRTKKGKELTKFLRSFERTNCWDVDRLLNIEKQSLHGSFYPADLFKLNDTIYIFLDSQYRKTFEAENDGFVEITLGEMERAIEDYNKD